MRQNLRNARELHGANVRGEDYPHKELTERIIGCAICVHRALGPGYLEAIYENAMGYELRKQRLSFERQRSIKIVYDGFEVGKHRIDLLVEGKVVVELKSVDMLVPKHLAQVISTLKAAHLQVGLLLNFDEARMIDGVKRVVLTNS